MARFRALRGRWGERKVERHVEPARGTRERIPLRVRARRAVDDGEAFATAARAGDRRLGVGPPGRDGRERQASFLWRERIAGQLCAFRLLGRIRCLTLRVGHRIVLMSLERHQRTTVDTVALPAFYSPEP